MGDLIRNLYDTPEGRNMSDVTFVLDDGTKLHAHKLILITACPHFEAIFHRPMENNQEPVQEIKIEDVQADVFRIMLKTIYNSGRYSEVKEQDDADKLIPIMEAANRYLLPNLVAILAKEVTECAEAGDWDKLLPHLKRLCELSQLPRIAEVYKKVRGCIFWYLHEEIQGKKEPLWEKICQEVQTDVIDVFFRNTSWEMYSEENRMYIHLLGEIVFMGAPFTELIDKINSKLCPFVQSFENKETFIKVMEEIINLEGQQEEIKAEIHLKIKTLLEKKSWEELCQTAFGDVVKLLKHVVDHNNDPEFELEFEPVIPSRYSNGPTWYRGDSFEESWKLYSGFLEFGDKHKLPRLVDHCELLLMDAIVTTNKIFNTGPEMYALSVVLRTSGKKIFENIHKIGMCMVLLELPKYLDSPELMELSELEIVFFRDNYHHFEQETSTELDFWYAIDDWCHHTTNNDSEAKDKYDRIKACDD